jgi:hypothetical protein
MDTDVVFKLQQEETKGQADYKFIIDRFEEFYGKHRDTQTQIISLTQILNHMTSDELNYFRQMIDPANKGEGMKTFRVNFKADPKRFVALYADMTRNPEKYEKHPMAIAIQNMNTKDLSQTQEPAPEAEPEEPKEKSQTISVSRVRALKTLAKDIFRLCNQKWTELESPVLSEFRKQQEKSPRPFPETLPTNLNSNFGDDMLLLNSFVKSYFGGENFNLGEFHKCMPLLAKFIAEAFGDPELLKRKLSMMPGIITRNKIFVAALKKEMKAYQKSPLKKVRDDKAKAKASEEQAKDK